MDEADAREIVEEGLELVFHWLDGVCEIEDAASPLTSLCVCIRCGQIVCESHGQMVRRDWLDQKHSSVQSILTCLQNRGDWGERQIFGKDFAGYYYWVLVHILELSPTRWESDAGRFCKELMEKLQKEGNNFDRMKARGGLYPILSIRSSPPDLRDEVWLCSDCAKELEVNARQIIETARLMAKDITRKELEDEAYRREKMTEARKFLREGKYSSAVKTLKAWRREREDLFDTKAQELLRKAEKLEKEKKDRDYRAKRIADASKEIKHYNRPERAVQILEGLRKERPDLFDENAEAWLHHAEKLAKEREQAKRAEEKRKREERKRNIKESEKKLDQVRSLLRQGYLGRAKEVLDEVYTYGESSLGTAKRELEKELEETEKTDRTVRVVAGAVFGLIGAPIMTALVGWNEGICLSMGAIIGAILGAWATWYFTVREDYSYSSSKKAPILNLNKMDGVIRMIVAGLIGLAPTAIPILLIAAIAASCS